MTHKMKILDLINNKTSALEVMHEPFIGTCHYSFEVKRIDTCCNWSSIILLAQYEAYCKDFGLKNVMRAPTGRGLTGKGGVQITVSSISIYVPLKWLDLIIYVDFVVFASLYQNYTLRIFWRTDWI